MRITVVIYDYKREKPKPNNAGEGDSTIQAKCGESAIIAGVAQRRGLDTYAIVRPRELLSNSRTITKP